MQDQLLQPSQKAADDGCAIEGREAAAPLRGWHQTDVASGGSVGSAVAVAAAAGSATVVVSMRRRFRTPGTSRTAAFTTSPIPVAHRRGSGTPIAPATGPTAAK